MASSRSPRSSLSSTPDDLEFEDDVEEEDEPNRQDQSTSGESTPSSGTATPKAEEGSASTIRHGDPGCFQLPTDVPRIRNRFNVIA